MVKLKAGIDISLELMKVDGQITDARKLGDRKTVSELRITHKKLSKIQADGIETIKGDKKPAKREQRGEVESNPENTQTTIESSDN